jgi:hypothetical protein
MSGLKGKRVLLFQQRGWGKGVGRLLARKLYAEGCRLAALTSTKATHERIVNQTDAAYDLIVDHDEVMSQPKKYLGADKISLKEICEALDVDSIWPFVWSLRMFVRDYGEKYYYSFRQNVSDEGIIEYVRACYKMVKDVFERFDPDIVVAPNFVSLHHIMTNLVAQKRGVKMIALTDSKIRGISIFAHNYLGDKGALFDRVEELNSGGADSLNRERARQYIAEFREHFKKPLYTGEPPWPTSFWRRVRKELSPYTNVARWYLKRDAVSQKIESVGVWSGYRPPRIILRDHYAGKRYRRFAERCRYYPFEAVGRFVYFPLQMQPETIVDVVAPLFSNQIETARQIAMSLPYDYTLVVKEHPAMVGIRAPGYLEKVARTVNVKLIDYRIPTEAVLKRAALVIGSSGTTMAEAAFYRKPAIQLGATLKLPNVFHHTDMSTLNAKIKEVLNITLDTEEYERRLENYVAAVYDTGTDLDYGAIYEGRERDQGKLEELWKVYKKEIERVVR